MYINILGNEVSDVIFYKLNYWLFERKLCCIIVLNNNVL